VATVPVMYAAAGNCHVYVHSDADLEMARRIAFNAKVQRPGVCNSAETLLVNSAVAERFLPGILGDLQEAGVEPDIWKIEGLDRREDCLHVAETARRDGRGDVGCIVLGRGEDEAHVHTWLTTAAGVPGFIGFAVGRTTFWEPLIAWREQKSSQDNASAEIARRYRQWVDVFAKAHAS
jgi:myo-inositol catabolism protein IolC